MRYYHNLLNISHGTADETVGLKQALSLGRNNRAPLKIRVVGPEFPKEFSGYQKKYEESLLAQLNASVQSTKQAIKLEEDAVDIAMDSLRKYPCAVWLCRPIKHSRKHIQVAVAIDPETQEPAAEALSKRLLTLARSLADGCSGELQVISCWDYLFESYLRGNAWMKVADSDLAHIVMRTKQEHRSALKKLFEISGISNTHHVHHLRGKAADLIPNPVKQKKIDTVVMGTVARTGIPGFMSGNTVEKIVQILICLLMTLKPQGFISPVKPY